MLHGVYGVRPALQQPGGPCLHQEWIRLEGSAHLSSLGQVPLDLVIAYLSPGQQHLHLTDRNLEIALGKQGSLSLLAAVVGFLSFRIFLCLLQWNKYLHNG